MAGVDVAGGGARFEAKHSHGGNRAAKSPFDKAVVTWEEVLSKDFTYGIAAKMELGELTHEAVVKPVFADPAEQNIKLANNTANGEAGYGVGAKLGQGWDFHEMTLPFYESTKFANQRQTCL